MEMNPGKLNKRVQIQSPTVTHGLSGEASLSWATITNGDRWAAIRPATGRELVVADQVAAELSHVVEVRYVAGVTAKCRVVYGSRTFSVNSVVDEDERHERLWLYCKEAV
jgi:SPP1 family predicted phage head-tail adaptor